MLVIDWNQVLQMGITVLGGAGLLIGTIWVGLSSRGSSRKELDSIKEEARKATERCNQYEQELEKLKIKRDNEIAEMKEDIKLLKSVMRKMINRGINNSSF